jgi:hypothetical protein
MMPRDAGYAARSCLHSIFKRIVDAKMSAPAARKMLPDRSVMQSGLSTGITMNRHSEAIRDQRLELYHAQNCLCAYCGMPLAFEEAQLAHRIPETIWAFTKYGRKVIDSPLNKGMTHAGCNVKLNIQNNPLECAALVDRIRGEG